MRRLQRRWVFGAAAVSVAVTMMPGVVRAALPQPEGWPAILSQSSGPELAIARGVREQDITLSTEAGPLCIHALDVDLTAPGLKVQAVVAGDKVFNDRGETVSSMANRTGAVAGINGDFYDIGNTYGPLNIIVAGGQLYRSPISWAALAIDAQNRAYVVKFSWHGRLTVLPGGENLDVWQKKGQGKEAPSGQTQPLAAYNSFLGDDGIFFYDDKFGHAFPAPSPGAHRAAVYLSKTANPRVYTVESIVENTAVQPVSAGKAVLIGHGPWADWLVLNLVPGEKIEVGLDTAPDWRNYQTVIGGGPILLRDGQIYDDPNKPVPGEATVRNPLMAVGISADGRKMALVAVDGRKPGTSIGLTQREMAAYFKALGYKDAIGFDSGGSVDMVVRKPGDSSVTVVNLLSDGFERRVADGLFVYSSLPPEPPSGSGGQPAPQPGGGQPGSQPGGSQPGGGAQPGSGGAVTLPDLGPLVTGRAQVWQETLVTTRNGSDLTVDVLTETADRVRAADTDTRSFVIPVQSDAQAIHVRIPDGVWRAVRDKTGGAGLVLVQTPLGAYQLPVSAVDTGGNGGVEVVVRRADPAQLPLNGLVGQSGASLIGNPVAFEVYKWNSQGKTAVDDFGHLYIRHLIPLGQVDAGPDKTGVYAFDPNRRTWVPVPVRFVKGSGGTVSALVSQPANRVYVVVNRTRTFEDLRNHWAAAQVGKLVAEGVLNGVDASHFAPDAPVTRGQFAVMLARALGIDDKVARQAAFADVPAGAWNRHEVDVVAQEGLMSGVSATAFAERDPMTREQMIAVLGRAMRYVNGNIPPSDPGVLAKFADRAAVSDWAVSDVATMVQAGVVVGTDGKLEPGRPATRAEAAVMLGKMLTALGLD